MYESVCVLIFRSKYTDELEGRIAAGQTWANSFRQDILDSIQYVFKIQSNSELQASKLREKMLTPSVL